MSKRDELHMKWQWKSRWEKKIKIRLKFYLWEPQSDKAKMTTPDQPPVRERHAPNRVTWSTSIDVQHEREASHVLMYVNPLHELDIKWCEILLNFVWSRELGHCTPWSITCPTPSKAWLSSWWRSWTSAFRKTFGPSSWTLNFWFLIFWINVAWWITDVNGW